MRPRLGPPSPSALRSEANWPLALAVLALSACAASCGQIAGLDDYAIGDATPSNPCGPNEVPVAGECETVGVTACPNGASPEGGGCPALLTEAPCPTGVETFGSAICSTLSQSLCGTAPLPAGASAAYYVDGERAGDGDGTKEKPWKTIQRALEVAKDGTVILIAKGDYEEDLIVYDARFSTGSRQRPR